MHVTFALRKGDCPSVHLGENTLPHSDSVKYLGVHLDRKLTWTKHLKAKREQLNITYRTMLWLLGRNSKLTVDNKLLIYKAVLKPVWMYGIQLWGSASNSNLSIIQRMQNSILRTISGVPWFVTNDEIHKNLEMNTVKEEIRLASKHYQQRLASHPNELAVQLGSVRAYSNRLKRHDIMKLHERV